MTHVSFVPTNYAIAAGTPGRLAADVADSSLCFEESAQQYTVTIINNHW